MLGSIAGATTVRPVHNGDSYVSPAEATLVAQRHLQWASANVPDFRNWKDAKLSRPVVYYFPDGTKSAYEFTVLVKGKPDGFILVAAQRYMPPVLEFGKGEAPSNHLAGLRTIVETKGHHTGNLLYYGASTYGIQVDSNKVISLVDSKIRRIPTNITMHFEKSHLRISKKLLEMPVKDSMVSVLEDDRGNENLISITKTISGVPAWTSTDIGGRAVPYPLNVGPTVDPWSDWDGCAAVAGSMIIAYYEPQLKDDWNREAIIDVLHHTMEIDDGTGGSVWQTQVEGINNFKEEWDRLKGWIVSEPVYHDFTATFYEYWSDSDILSEVNNNHPFILGLENGGSAADGTGPYGNHAVTGVGYIAACSEDNTYCEIVYIEIHDTWNSETHYIYNGNWEDADIIKVRAS